MVAPRLNRGHPLDSRLISVKDVIKSNHINNQKKKILSKESNHILTVKENLSKEP